MHAYNNGMGCSTEYFVLKIWQLRLECYLLSEKLFEVILGIFDGKIVYVSLN